MGANLTGLGFGASQEAEGTAWTSILASIALGREAAVSFSSGEVNSALFLWMKVASSDGPSGFLPDPKDDYLATS